MLSEQSLKRALLTFWSRPKVCTYASSFCWGACLAPTLSHRCSACPSPTQLVARLSPNWVSIQNFNSSPGFSVKVQAVSAPSARWLLLASTLRFSAGPASQLQTTLCSDISSGNSRFENHHANGRMPGFAILVWLPTAIRASFPNDVEQTEPQKMKHV